MPIARMDYTQSDNDRANIAYAKRVLHDIWEAAGAQDTLTIDRYAHLVGGCRMGTSPENSVIDADHRAWGVPNLFIADGSVMPTQGSREPGADDHGARLAPGRAPRSQAHRPAGRGGDGTRCLSCECRPTAARRCPASAVECPPPGAWHLKSTLGTPGVAIRKISTRPRRPLSVTLSVTRAPRRSTREPRIACRLTGLVRLPHRCAVRPLEAAARRGSSRSIDASGPGTACATRRRLRVPEPAAAHRFAIEPGSGGNGSTTPSQFSSTPLPRTSRAPGWIAGSASLQSCGRGEPSRVAVEVRRVGAGAVLVDAVVRDVDRAGVDRGVGVVAVGRAAHAVAVGVALDLLARDARVGVVGDRGVVAGAAVDLLGAAVAGDDVVVAGAAVEDVDAAAAEQPVVAAAAVEDHRDRDAALIDGDVVAVAEVEDHRVDAVLAGSRRVCRRSTQRAGPAGRRAPRRRSA